MTQPEQQQDSTRHIVHICDECGSDKAFLTDDPYISEICEREVIRSLCADCYRIAAEEI
jgi:hypothetical protein